jgi:phosphatidylglycerol:prolipoprotein diacylglycerol transferase
MLATLPYWTLGPWQLGPVQIHSFGMFVAIGLMICFHLIGKRGEEKLGVSNDAVQNFAFYLVGIGWPMSHVFEVLMYRPGVLLEDPLELFRFWGSISSYGGLMGGFIGLAVWKWRNPKEDLLKWADLGAWGLAVPWFFGRIGCASVHDHPGHIAPDWWPLAIDFPARANLPAGPRHDLGFYEALWWSWIVVALFILDRKPKPKGYYLAVVPMMYAPGRFLFDFLRVPPELGGDARYLGLTPAQYLSLLIFALGFRFWLKIRNNPPMEWEKFHSKKESPDNASNKKEEANA